MPALGERLPMMHLLVPICAYEGVNCKHEDTLTSYYYLQRMADADKIRHE